MTPGEHSSEELVQGISFGSRVAEDEVADLRTYFVQTETWRQVREGEVDVVFAPKGSGKSALYSMLLAEEDALFDDKVLLAPAENPTGAPAFANVGDTNPSETELTHIWKLYFLVIISQELESYGVNTPQTRTLFNHLQEADLLPGELAKPSILMMVKEYVRRLLTHKSHEVSMQLAPDGTPIGFTGKIEFAEPSVADSRAGHVSVDYLFGLVEETLVATEGFSLWLLLDRLDVAFASQPDLERKALRALFRAYSDLTPFGRIHIKIFLRSDIWESISDDGFREASHIVREATIEWNKDSLRQLIVRRLAQSGTLLAHYETTSEAALSTTETQDEFFYKVFPAQVDTGSGKSATLDWALKRTQDGKALTAPRELIHLLIEVRLAQLERIRTGQPEPAPPALFSPRSFDAALPAVSKVRLQRTLYAEYVDAKPFIALLAGEKSEHNVDSLARIWKIDTVEAERVASRLVDIGFFEPRGSKYWVPFIYRPALGLIQGAASEVSRSGRS